MRRRTSGVALATVIIFILLLSIIAIAMLTLMTNQAQLIESQIRRIKAQYVAEAAIWRNFMAYALGVQSPPAITPPVQETVDDLLYQATVSVESTPCTGPGGACQMNAAVIY